MSPPRSIPSVIAVALAVVLTGPDCSCTRSIARPYAAPTAQNLIADLTAASQRAHSFQIESLMDYWVGNERVKGTVLLMGRAGAFVRINALSPTGNNVAGDLACNGASFQFIDYNQDCQLVGPCNRDSIARLLRVSLDPDDFLLLVMGLTPFLGNAEGTLAWDASHGHEVLTLTARDDGLVQTIALSGRYCEGKLPGGAGSCPWEVVSSVLRDASGNELWNLQNKDFATVRGEDGTVFRVPGKTQFKQPHEKADLLVRWREHTLNPTLDDSKFTMEIPAGLRSCASGPPP